MSITQERQVVTPLMGALILAAMSFIVAADEVPVPEFRSAPLEYINRHSIAYRWDNNRLEEVEDLLLIGDISDKKLTFYLSTIGDNHHTCYVTGDTQKEGDHYLFTFQQCRLQIKFDSEKALVSDIDEQCRQYFCGMMGYIQAEFRKK